MPYQYLYLEPNFFAVGVICFFIFLAVRQAELRLSLSLAMGLTAARAAYELIVTHGYSEYYPALYSPFPHYIHSLKALVWCLAPLSLSRLSSKQVRLTGAIIFCLTVAMTLFFRVFGAPDAVSGYFGAGGIGLIYQPSMNPALLAVTLPFVSRPGVRIRYKALAEVFTLAIVLESHHLTPLITYLAVQATWLFTYRRSWSLYFTLFAVVGCLLFPPASHGGGRMGEYWFFFDQYLAHWDVLWGMGINKFFIYGPILQATIKGVTKDFWSFLHSDWGELFFQQGIVGAVLWLWVYVDTIREAYRKDHVLLQSAAGMGAFMIGYFPLHVTSSALVACLCLTVLKAKFRR